ncbi:MAG: cyclodeaminase/cyclohydrolase family protein [Planctomycetes bacterium]|nr:cyclodeaminase/cyclohydrolase family protein [Planctomycetota bacterium]
MTLLDRSLRDLLSSLAAKTPTPGGGSIAALNAAMGAALVSMAARFTAGKKYESVEADARAVAEACDALRERASALVDADSAAYDHVTAAFGLPKNTDAEKAARTEAVQKALRVAIAVPAETLDVSMKGLALAAGFAAKSNKNLASDVLVGAGCLLAAVEGARANVRINAASLADPAGAREYIQSANAAYARAAELHAAVRDAVEPTFAPAK